MSKFIPETPGGSILAHLVSKTEDEAWNKLMAEAAHLPLKDKNDFIRRGYRVVDWDEAYEKK